MLMIDANSYIFLFLTSPTTRDLLFFAMLQGNPDTLNINPSQDSTLMLTLIKKENI